MSKEKLSRKNCFWEELSHENCPIIELPEKNCSEKNCLHNKMSKERIFSRKILLWTNYRERLFLGRIVLERNDFFLPETIFAEQLNELPGKICPKKLSLGRIVPEKIVYVKKCPRKELIRIKFYSERIIPWKLSRKE